MATNGTVIGCVWGAHQALTDKLSAHGDPAPSYEWCEAQWNAGLRKTAPGSTYLPAWLEQELQVRWRAEQSADRRARGDVHYHQLGLPLWRPA